MDDDKYKIFNTVLMRMGRSTHSQKHLLKPPISQDILDDMVKQDYLEKYEKDGITYYRPTSKSKNIW